MIWNKLVREPGPVSRIYGIQFRGILLVLLDKHLEFGYVRSSDHARIFSGLSDRAIVIQWLEEWGLFDIQVWSSHGRVHAPEELPAAVMDVLLASWVQRRGGRDWTKARDILCGRLNATFDVAKSVDMTAWALG